MRSRAGFLVAVLIVAVLLGGVTATSVAAATKTTVTWKVSSLTAGQVKSLSAVATSNSPGVKTWSKTGSCVLSTKSNPPKLTMGTGRSCTLLLTIAKSGKYPAKTSTKGIRLQSYRVGQVGPGGGIIFYVDLTRPAGSQYFEMACAGWSDSRCGGSDLADPGIVWGCGGTPIPGADGTAIGAGEQNTTDIVTGCPETVIAAKVAIDLVLGGQSDWFLPSKDELNQMYIQHPVIGGFSGEYWGSSEYAGNDAWYQSFYPGYQDFSGKYNAVYVRPIRSF